MLVEQKQLKDNVWRNVHLDDGFSGSSCGLVIGFGAREIISDPAVYQYLLQQYPSADIVLSSTSGEILGDRVYDNTLAVSAIVLQQTQHKCVSLNIGDINDSYTAGAMLMKQLEGSELATVLVISDGALVNGSELTAGLNDNNTANVTIAGGLAGDAARFKQTVTGLNAVPSPGNIIAIGFYGAHIHAGHGSVGGWEEFGPERTITRSHKNVLFELDDKNALTLYKQYLGHYANELPSSALLFPLALRNKEKGRTLVRTILQLDEDQLTMTFAGNMPEGSKVRLMRSSFDTLVAASGAAAGNAIAGQPCKPQLAILISCVGRKLVLQETLEDEVEAANARFAAHVPVMGFYSYGEMSPQKDPVYCELHNQTMTILTLSEQ